MKPFYIVLVVLICTLISAASTNSTRSVRSKIEPIAPVAWNVSPVVSVQEETGATWSGEALSFVNVEQPIEAIVPTLSAATTQPSVAIDESKITYLCVNPELTIQSQNVDLFAAAIEKAMSLSPKFYMLNSVETQRKSLHWAFAALNPKYCSSIYGIYLEMQSYEKKGLPIPKELYDRMNKAVDFYFLMEESKARRVERRKK